MPISKDLFVKIIKLIQEQHSTNVTVSDALELVCDSRVVFGANNKFYEALMLLLKTLCNDIHNYIEWWLYDNVEKVIYSTETKTILWELDTPEDLYDFILDSQPYWTAEKDKI